MNPYLPPLEEPESKWIKLNTYEVLVRGSRLTHSKERTANRREMPVTCILHDRHQNCKKGRSLHPQETRPVMSELPNPLIPDPDTTDACYLATEGRDYLISHGVVLNDINNKTLIHTPFTIYPSPLPRELYGYAVKVQKDFNLLVHRVSRDHDFLRDSLKETIIGDPLTGRLFEIYSKAVEQGIYEKTITLGLLRSDYFCEASESNGGACLKQVELNAISGVSAHSVGAANLSRRLLLPLLGLEKALDKVVPNTALETKADALIHAWKLYGCPSAALMFVNLPRELEDSLYDHRHLEYIIRDRCPGIKVLRRTMREIHQGGKLAEDKTLYVDGQEIGLAYFRTGYTPEHFLSEEYFLGRELVELSRAAKSPSIAYQFVALKKIQQVLACPGVLERYFDDEETIARIRNTFTGLYSVDKGDEGDKNTAMAIRDPGKFVLKSQRDGGVESVYFGEDITKLLKSVSATERSQYILMDLIEPVVTPNYLVRHGQTEFTREETTVEFGIFGTVISDGRNVLRNDQGGYLVRSKSKDQEGGGVLSGVCCCSSLYLV